MLKQAPEKPSATHKFTQTKINLISLFVRLKWLHVELARCSTLRLRNQMQGVRRKLRCARAHNARYLDSCSVPPLRSPTPVPPARHFPREAFEKFGLWGGQARGAHMGEMKRANAYEEERRIKDRFASTLVIAASIIAAVRLARDLDISKPTPRLTSVIADSVGLARMILARVVR